jgi:RNA recognition motif-containing protein
MTAYILFDTRDNARRALAEHNTIVNGHHIRVDLAEPDKKVHLFHSYLSLVYYFFFNLVQSFDVTFCVELLDS